MNETITSANNSTIKQIRRLTTSAKARREDTTYIAEGIHVVRSLLASGHAPQLCLFAVSAAKNSEVAELLESIDISVPEIAVADSLFESITSIHASVGILVTFSLVRPAEGNVNTLSTTAILLEDIQDPGNLGTVLRTAVATGIKDVILSSGCASPWSPKAMRAGMGAQFSAMIHEDADIIDILTNSTIPTLVTSLSSESKSLYATDLRQPVLWVFGSEGRGVSEAAMQRATTHIMIPQVASSVESLNVAAAVAVCLYEQYRQNNESQLGSLLCYNSPIQL